jgi:hypothetical protein
VAPVRKSTVALATEIVVGPSTIVTLFGRISVCVSPTYCAPVVVNVRRRPRASSSVRFTAPRTVKSLVAVFAVTSSALNRTSGFPRR